MSIEGEVADYLANYPGRREGDISASPDEPWWTTYMDDPEWQDILEDREFLRREYMSWLREGDAPCEPTCRYGDPRFMRMRDRMLARDVGDPVRSPLAETLGNGENFGVRWDDEEGDDLFPDGNTAKLCTAWAEQARRVFGERAKMFAFGGRIDNPHSQISRDYGGHEFVIVDDRFIVDGWATLEYGIPAVLDLQDPVDLPMARMMYGDPRTWTRNWLGKEQRIDAESPEEREALMQGVSISPAGLLWPAGGAPTPSP